MLSGTRFSQYRRTHDTGGSQAALMPVYVDDALIPAAVPNGQTVHESQWSHLVATTPRELHQFATRVLHQQRGYFQDHWPYPHYDLTAVQRQMALANGAIPVKYGDPEALNLGRWLPPVLVTSSRRGLTPADVEKALGPHFDPRKVLISGHARGGDLMSESFWQRAGGETDPHPVTQQDWDVSRGAGHARNARMVAKAAARGGECVAIVAPCSQDGCPDIGRHDSHGTAQCVRLARDAGLEVDLVRVTPAERKHDWKTTGPDQKECSSCRTTATRSWQPGGKSWTASFLVPGQSVPAQAPPPCMDYDLVPAPAPDQSKHPVRRGRYDETVECGCGNTFPRPIGAVYSQCLKCELDGKMAGASPEAISELQAWAAWNAAAQAHAARPAAAGQEATAPAGEPAAPVLTGMAADREAVL